VTWRTYGVWKRAEGMHDTLNETRALGRFDKTPVEHFEQADVAQLFVPDNERINAGRPNPSHPVEQQAA